MQIKTPQFHRLPSQASPSAPPSHTSEWELLRYTDAEVLKRRGLEPWEHLGREIMLFPAEWFGHIPTGFEIVDIFGRSSEFDPQNASDDTRFGFLSYGVPLCNVAQCEVDISRLEEQVTCALESRGCSQGMIYRSSHFLHDARLPPGVFFVPGIVASTKRKRSPGKINDIALLALCTSAGSIITTSVPTLAFCADFDRIEWRQV